VEGEGTLHIFDLDGTLAETWETALLPGVAERVSALDGDIAVATNQAGVAWNAVEGEPYPRPAEIGRRLVGVAEALPVLKEALWLVSIGDEEVSIPPERWRVLAAGVTRAAAPLWVRTSSDLAWRKPRPGMLLEACRTFEVAPSEAVFVGDHETDAEAAAAAGMRFVYADRFFGTV
jgi:phosphoglycolate phosphatase-like HAD superfamily hydrolase